MTNIARLKHVNQDLPVSELQHPLWQAADEIIVDCYWSGESAPIGRRVHTRMLWSTGALYVRFEANQAEPLVIAEEPDLNRKTIGLWDRDVCEIFIAPDKDAPNKYFEFEIAPTGEWIDLGIQIMPDKRVVDWEYASEMQSAARIEKDRVVMAIKIPFVSLGRTPKAGDVWLGNLFRCIGNGPTRGYLAWRPTFTKEPAFHVPAAFGRFQFVHSSHTVIPPSTAIVWPVT